MASRIIRGLHLLLMHNIVSHLCLYTKLLRRLARVHNRPLLNLILQRVPNPRLGQIFALLPLGLLLLRPHLLHTKLAHGPQVVPLPSLILRHCVLSISHVVYNAKPPV